MFSLRGPSIRLISCGRVLLLNILCQKSGTFTSEPQYKDRIFKYTRAIQFKSEPQSMTSPLCQHAEIVSGDREERFLLISKFLNFSAQKHFFIHPLFQINPLSLNLDYHQNKCTSNRQENFSSAMRLHLRD